MADDLPPSERRELRAGSGIDDLIDALKVKVQRRRARLDLARNVGECLQKLAGLDSQMVSAAAAADDIELQRNLARSTHRLIELRQARVGWHNDLLGRLARIEGDVIGLPGSGGDKLEAELKRLDEKYRAAAQDSQSQEQFDKLALELQTDAVRACGQTSHAIERAIWDAFEMVVRLGVAVDAEIVATPTIVVAPGELKKPSQDRSWVEYYNTIAPALGIQGMVGGVVAAFGVGSMLQGWGLLLIPPLAALAIKVQNVAKRRAHYLQWMTSYLNTVDGIARITCRANIAGVSSPEVQDKVDATIDAEIAATETIVASLNSALTGDAETRAADAHRAQSIVGELAARRDDAHELLTRLSAEPERAVG
jgi:hypothetical protein